MVISNCSYNPRSKIGALTHTTTTTTITTRSSKIGVAVLMVFLLFKRFRKEISAWISSSNFDERFYLIFEHGAFEESEFQRG